MSETKEFELDAAAIEAIVKALPSNEDAITAAVEKALKANKEADIEANKLNKNADPKEQKIENKYADMSKEVFAVKQLSAALTGSSELGEMNAYAMKTLADAGMVTKATYLNAGTDADGGYFVPAAELLTDVLNVLPEFTPLANMARVINLNDGDSIDVSSLTADVIMTEVGSEGGSKTVTKPTLGDTIVTVREFAGIALMTKKLIKQSAIDVYAVLRDSFARAIAKKREQLLLTDSSSGIVNKSGVVVTVSPSTNTLVASITLKQLKAMPFAVPTQSAAGGSYVFSRLLVASLAGREDSTGQPVITINSQNGGALSGTFNGYPYVVAETLGTTDAVSTVHAVFGNWSKYAIVLRQGAIDTAVFDSGTVTDGGSVVHNLIQENKLAMRVETWENVGYPIPSAFNVLKTAAS